MRNQCRICGSTESQALANAKALGLQAELQNGVYTCCQLDGWSKEQSWAWSEAATEDRKLADALSNLPEGEQANCELVPVRFRHTRLRFRTPDRPA